MGHPASKPTAIRDQCTCSVALVAHKMHMFSKKEKTSLSFRNRGEIGKQELHYNDIVVLTRRIQITLDLIVEEQKAVREGTLQGGLVRI